jgi:hypothetical protein
MANDRDPYSEWLGIKDKQRPLTNYQLLGLPCLESRTEKIESHAQEQLAKLASFLKGEHALQAKRLTFEIASAKTCLLNPATKASYDAGLRARQGGSPAASAAPAKKPPSEPVAAPRPGRPPAAAVGASPPAAKATPAASVRPPTPPPEEPADEYALEWPVAAPQSAATGGQFLAAGTTLSHRRKVRRQMPSWLPVTAIGGITMAIVGVLFALTRNPASVPVASAPAAEKTVEQTRAAEPLPPPKENAPTGAAQTGAKSNAPVKTVRPSTAIAEAQGPIASGGRGVGGRASVAEKSLPAARSGSSPGAGAKETASASPKSSAKKQAASKPFRRPSVNGSAGLPFQLRLPSGETLSGATFDVPDHWETRFFPPMREPMGVVYATFYAQGDAKPALIFPSESNGRVQGVFTCRRDGSLHGAAVTLDKNGRPQTLASYLNGKLHGSLWLWNDNGVARFYGEYKNGKKDGLICGFESGTLQLVQKCSKDKVSETYLVQWTEDGPTVTPSGELSADKNIEMDKSLDDLGKLEREIAQNERKLKNKLKTWVRRWQVALQAPGKAQRERERIRERAEQQQESAKRWADKVHGAAGQ